MNQERREVEIGASCDERSSKASLEMNIVICEEKIIKANKIVPKKYTDEGKVIKDSSIKPMGTEKTLRQIGISGKARKNWHKIIQPKKSCLYKLLRQMISNYKNTNLQIRIGKALFNCHMMVLQCYSRFFVECDDILVIRLPEDKVSVRAFQMIYEWMIADYPLVQREGILELIVAAEFLKIDELYNQCWVCLDDLYHFSEDSAFLLYLESRPFQIDGMMSLMLNRIGKFFLTLVASKEFVEFELEEVCMLLMSNYISVNTEIEVFMAAIRWLHYKWDERKDYVPKIMYCIRFVHMPVSYLVTLCNRQQILSEINRVINNEKTYQFICDSIAYCTTRLCYGEGDDAFQNFAKIKQFKNISPRRWLYDPDCPYHHQSFSCKEIHKISYESFLRYLEHLQKHGRNKWFQLEYLTNKTQISKSCCVKVNNQTIHPPQDREEKYIGCDQGIQVEVNNGLRKLSNSNVATDVPSVKRKPTMTNRSAQYSEQIFSQTNLQPIIDETPVQESSKDDPLKDVQSITSSMQLDSEKIESDSFLEYQFASNLDSEQQENETESLEISSSARLTTAATVGTCAMEELPAENQEAVLPKCCKMSSNSFINLESFDALAYPKILVFGGIDPYCNGSFPLESNHDGPCYNHDNFGDHVLFFEKSLGAWTHLTYLPFGSRYHHVVVKCNGLIYVIGGTKTRYGCAKRAEFAKSIWVFNPATLSWNLECCLPELRRDFAAIAVESNCERCESSQDDRPTYGFYIIGGEGLNETILDTVWFYDILRKKWIQKPSLTVGRYGFTATIMENEIWVAGGIIEVDDTKNCQHCSDPSRSTFCPIHHNFSNASPGQDLGAGEGFFPNQKMKRKYIITNSVECYSLKCPVNRNTVYGDTLENQCGYCNGLGGGKWIKSKYNLRIPRLFGRFCKISQSDLFLIGGIGFDPEGCLTSMASIDCFKFKEKEWVLCGNLDIARHGHDVVHVDGRMVIVGGVSTLWDKALPSVEIFSLAMSAEPLNIPDLPYPVSGCSAVVLD